MSSTERLGKAIVIDLGTGSIKVGYSGDSCPKFIIPNKIGIPKYPRSLLPGDEEIYMGNQILEYKGLLNIVDVMEHGCTNDLDKMYRMFDYIYGHLVLNVNPTEHPVLITEPVLSSYKSKTSIMQHLFEALNVPAISFSIAPMLSLYGNGFTTGCVLDSGAGVTSVTCMCDGYSLIHSFKRSNVAGKSVTDFLLKSLYREGHYFNQQSSFHILEDIKSSICQINPIQFTTDAYHSSSVSVPYTLPDGSIINIGRSRLMAPEILFQPLLIGDESSGFHQLLYDTIRTVDHEVRRKLYKTILLSGGSTMFPGTEARLLHEMKTLTGNQCNIKIHSPKNRTISTFKGGSIVTMLDSYRPLWIKKSDFMDKRKF